MSVNTIQLDDGTLRLRNQIDSIDDVLIGGPSTPSFATPRYMDERVAIMPLVASDTAAAMLAWQNPFAYSVIVTGLVVYVTTKTNAACTADFGQAATAVTSNNLITGLDIGSATGVFDNNTDKGASGKTRQLVASGAYVTGSKASGASAGLVGWAYIYYVPTLG